MGQKVRVGIMGCANIARRSGLPALRLLQNVEVVSIASRDPAKATAWAKEFNLPRAQTYDQLINDPEIDALYLPLPIGLHQEWIIKAAVAGKHVISEKSLAESYTVTKEIVKNCQKNNVVLYENFMCDYHPQHQKVLDLIKEGGIGTPAVFRGYFGFPLLAPDNFRYDKTLGGGCLNDAGAYTIFMARKILGCEPVTVMANLDYDQSRGVDMRGAAELDFAAGLVAQVAFNFDAVYQNNYSVWGSRGLINVDRAYTIPSDMKPQIEFITNINNQQTITNLDLPPANHFELIMADFCDTILNREKQSKKINKMYNQILAQAKVLEAVRISAKEKRLVVLEEIV